MGHREPRARHAPRARDKSSSAGSTPRAASRSRPPAPASLRAPPSAPRSWASTTRPSTTSTPCTAASRAPVVVTEEGLTHATRGIYAADTRLLLRLTSPPAAPAPRRSSRPGASTSERPLHRRRAFYWTGFDYRGETAPTLIMAGPPSRPSSACWTPPASSGQRPVPARCVDDGAHGPRSAALDLGPA